MHTEGKHPPRVRLAVGLWATFGLALTGVPALAAPAKTNLAKELVSHAPRIVRNLQKRGCKNVGVLAFQVTREGSPLSPAGTLNRDLARRLAAALVLALPRRAAPGISEASDVAATLKDADYLTASGRQALFAARYPLAWGSRTVAVDGFVTGTARISADLKETTIAILAFDRNSTRPDKLFAFTVPGDVSTMRAQGESFNVRGPKPMRPASVAAVLAAAVAVRKGKLPHPLVDASAPVTLTVLFDGKPVPLKIARGQATVPEPRPGQKVMFLIRRRGSGKQRYGLVLKVNGVNTLFRQELPDAECAKWVLGSDDKELRVRGFQLDARKIAEIVGLSKAQSARAAGRYGRESGLITLAVFAERQEQEEPPSLELSAEDVRAVARGLFPPKRPKNLMALRAQLRAGIERGQRGRGLVGPGKEKDSPLREMSFEADPVPLLLASIRYHRPRKDAP